jgi:hypothetical protein
MLMNSEINNSEKGLKGNEPNKLPLASHVANYFD